MLSDIEIARAARLRPIAEIGAKIVIPEDALYPYGRHIAKLEAAFLSGLASRADGKLILVTAISPTPAGEGKTTTTIGLGDALNRIGKQDASICLREPSLGPCFGMKGGAAGGGYAQVAPMDEINLHFTGDFHAITAANNLLAAMIDNHIYWGNALGHRPAPHRLAPRAGHERPRAARDRRSASAASGNGFPREEGFDITVASEMMAIFCLARRLERPRGAARPHRSSAYRRDKQPVTAADLKARRRDDRAAEGRAAAQSGADAGGHAGARARRAVRQHRPRLQLGDRHHAPRCKLADYVVTEAGFGADLGAEKFFDIKCRKAGLGPAAAVHRRHRARAEDARRRRQGRARRRKRSRR